MRIKDMMVAALLGVAMVIPMTLRGQEEKPKFKFTPQGRILLDGAVFAPEHKAGFSDGVAMPDLRLGGRAEYGNWMASIDVGYAFGKIGMKDVYLQYTFDDYNLLRGGYFIQQFGLQSATSGSFKETFETPTSDAYAGVMSRHTGIMYIHQKGQWFATASAIVGTKLTERASDAGKVSVGGISRLVWRPQHEQGKIAQVGISGWYQSAYHKSLTDEEGNKYISPGYFDFKASYPTKVDDVTLISTNVDNARGVFKLTPELLVSRGRFALSSQYYYMNINRKDGKAFVSNGAYGIFRALLFGDKEYKYNDGLGCIATPNGKTLECVLGYDYMNANCSSAGIYGGISNDWSVTFNYYINKYMLARLRYSYTNVRGGAEVPRNHVNIIEARIQFKF